LRDERTTRARGGCAVITSIIDGAQGSARRTLAGYESAPGLAAPLTQ
jgi:hypothetical protein